MITKFLAFVDEMANRPQPLMLTASHMFDLFSSQENLTQAQRVKLFNRLIENGII